jgi:hypothetical protein
MNKQLTTIVLSRYFCTNKFHFAYYSDSVGVRTQDPQLRRLLYGTPIKYLNNSDLRYRRIIILRQFCDILRKPTPQNIQIYFTLSFPFLLIFHN